MPKMPKLPKISKLSPAHLKALANAKLSDLIVAEVGRAKARIAELRRVYPSAPPTELAERLADAKKTIAGTSGAVSGIFGLVSVPFDMVLVAYLQLSVMIDVAVLHGANLKSTRAQDELIDLLHYANGLDPVVRASPRVLGQLAFTLLRHCGLPQFGRAIPVIASPVTAWLNNKAIVRACHEAIVFYGQEKKDQQHAEKSEKAEKEKKSAQA
ncbi:MAG: EcsC family protein [Myxococcales bacterium]|jgi:uncharacterized protein (DUF697 family)|nr:EcsC family protein [Myxococcales bacterium]